MATYRFKQWENGSTNPSRTINVQSDMTLTATYELYVPSTFTLAISLGNVGGNTTPPPGTYTHNEGTVVTVDALPNAGKQFDFWLLDGIQNVNDPIGITMNGNHTLVAYFKDAVIPQHTLYLSVATMGGTTSPSPGSLVSNEGTTRVVSAVPNAG